MRGRIGMNDRLEPYRFSMTFLGLSVSAKSKERTHAFRCSTHFVRLASIFRFGDG